MTTNATHPQGDRPLRGQWAVVTGASGGIGADIARSLARRGANVILVARSADKLAAVQAELTGQWGVEAEVIAQDLGVPGAAQALYDQVTALGHPVEMLINNAGFGLFGEFLEIDWEREQTMLQLDIVTLAHLTRLFAADMVARGSGYIMQIASNGAYLPSPLYASYAAAKAYVMNYGLAINYELRQTGVSVTVLSPGITRTGFHDTSGQDYRLYHRLTVMDSDRVAEIGVKGMLRRKGHVIPGWLNQLTVWSTRLMPRRLSAMVGYYLMR